MGSFSYITLIIETAAAWAVLFAVQIPLRIRKHPVLRTLAFIVKALTVMGTVSGRDRDKPAEAGHTPVPIGGSVTYKEAELTFLCRKIYQHMFSKEDLAPEIQEIYKNNTKTFPPDENGDWQPHWMFIGEILETDDRRRT